MDERNRWSRRSFLAASTGLVVAACSSDGSDGSTTTVRGTPSVPDAGAASTSTSAAADAPPKLTAADFDGLGSCSLTPEQTAGPFPLDEQFDRSDITEGRSGHPLRLGFRVVDESCAAVTGAAVEIWHTDATGDYSAFADGGGGKDEAEAEAEAEAEGTTFLRGTQAVDDDGIAEFATIYPGWYRGRAIHVHIRVHLDDDVALTSQVYFDEAYTEQVLATGDYAEFGPPDTTWSSDRIAGDPEADGTALSLTELGTGTQGLINLAILA